MRYQTVKRIVLASTSPRRRGLVATLDAAVEAAAPKVGEGPAKAGERPEALVARLATAKALSLARRHDDAFVLGADTVVVADDEVLGKPSTPAEATDLLRRLRGRAHRVVTGIAVVTPVEGRYVTVARSTDVTMRRYSDDEVAAYVAAGEPYDKAGGYAIQDRTFHPAESVRGCYLNVVGLSLCDVVVALRLTGARVAPRGQWPPDECGDCLLEDPREVAER